MIRDELRRALEESVLNAPGELDPSVRRAGFAGGEVPVEVAAFVRKLVDHAYKITDEEVAALVAGGFSEDKIFELVLAVSVGQASRRIDAAKKAIHAT